MEWNDLKKIFDTEGSKIIDWLEKEYLKIRSGRVNINMFNDIKFEAYGVASKITQSANIQILDSKTVIIKPYDTSLIQDISNAIINSNLKVNPQVNPDNIRLIFPMQTEENRKNNVKLAKELFEKTKTNIRNVRQEVQKKYKDLKDISKDIIFSFDNELDKITKLYNSKLENMFKEKETNLMQI